MSATKRDSIDGCGTSEEEFWAGYRDWSDSGDEATGRVEDLGFFEDRERVSREVRREDNEQS